MPGSARTCQSYWYKGLEVDVWSKPFYAGIWSTAHAAFQVQNNRRKQECFAHADAFGLLRAFACLPRSNRSVVCEHHEIVSLFSLGGQHAYRMMLVTGYSKESKAWTCQLCSIQ